MEILFVPGAALMAVFCGGAAAMDIAGGRVDNGWICTGIVLFSAERVREAVFLGEAPSVPESVAGFFIPAVLLMPFFLFRMIGAGDIKVLSAAGILMRPAGIVRFMLVTFLFAAAISLVRLVTDRELVLRFYYLRDYIRRYAASGQRESYRCRGGGKADVHMAVPAAMAAALWCSGL